MKQKPHRSLLEQATAILDLPPDTTLGLPRISLVGDRELRVENHRGILAYGTEEILVSGGGYIVHISGSELELRAMTGAELLITGQLTAVTLE